MKFLLKIVVAVLIIAIFDGKMFTLGTEPNKAEHSKRLHNAIIKLCEDYQKPGRKDSGTSILYHMQDLALKLDDPEEQVILENLKAAISADDEATCKIKVQKIKTHCEARGKAN